MTMCIHNSTSQRSYCIIVYRTSHNIHFYVQNINYILYNNTRHMIIIRAARLSKLVFHLNRHGNAYRTLFFFKEAVWRSG